MQQSKPSAFLFLFCLLMELIIMLSIYLYVSFKSQDTDVKGDAVYMAVMSIPVLLLHYFAAWALTCAGDLTKDFEDNGFFSPLKGFFNAIIFMILGLLIGYYRDLKYVMKNKDSLKIAEYGVIVQFFRVWCVGLVGIFAGIKDDGNISPNVIGYMLIARIVVEIVSNYTRGSVIKEE